MARFSPNAADTMMPFDIRLMNGVASTLYLLVALALLAAALLWLTRSPGLSFRVIQLEGELQRNSVATIRANATPRLAGNFVSMDLDKARAAFEGVPWVRQATLRRIWPDRLAVRLDEHHPVALWQGEDGNERLVNEFGEVFEANVGEVEDEKLPQFSGPEGSSAAMLSLYRRLMPLFAAQRLEPVTMQLSGRGSWSLELDSGAAVVLGRGSEDELVARSERFLRTVSQITSRFQRDLEYADLRHADGYAVRLRGITTTIVPAGAATKKPR
ncbi:MAG: cell division protein FtsQ/DivIB [Burkholderiaceae bacterium]|jgi:cell division protein FtsQ|nr:cell division protein FtsQ/DivIB [Burkholderiaceae bacterium]